MEMVYSASNNSFFAKNDVEKYEQAGWKLADIVEVTYDTYLEFIDDKALQGKVRIAGDDGHPAWADIPPLTHEQEVSKAEDNRQSLLANAKAITADWRTELALNIISDEDKSRLIEWMQYIKAVKAVDTSTAPNITWPEQPQ